MVFDCDAFAFFLRGGAFAAIEGDLRRGEQVTRGSDAAYRAVLRMVKVSNRGVRSE